jgi:hypothetical protein
VVARTLKKLTQMWVNHSRIQELFPIPHDTPLSVAWRRGSNIAKAPIRLFI